MTCLQQVVENKRTTMITGCKIRQLDPVLIDKIAAGEVIDGPYSIVKELLENSIDAGATVIKVYTLGAGMDGIIIEDNGEGIFYQDLPLSISRHATSKIETLDDIENIGSFGFRGEALASIASISHLEIKSKTQDENGAFLECRGGKILRHEYAACNRGTVIKIGDIFYSTPARKKYIKSERSENNKIYQTILKMAIANYRIHFSYFRDDKEFLALPVVENHLDRLRDIYGNSIAENLIPVKEHHEDIYLSGFIGKPDCYRSNRDAQYVFINGRSVELKNASFLVKKSYGELLPHGAHPYFFLMIDVNPLRVDVNVHPAKKEVRLLDEAIINSMIIRSVTSSIHTGNPISFSDLSGKYKEQFAVKHDVISETESLLSPATANFIIRNEHALQHTQNTNTAVTDTAESGKMKFLPKKHFGVIFGTYILAESEDGLYIIDQHTAHERVNFEKMKRKIQEQTGNRQSLLHPIVVSMLPDEISFILSHAEDLINSGFNVEQIGPNALAIREIPAFIEAGMETDLLHKMISHLASGDPLIKVYEDIAAMKACKASIKKNDVISPSVLNGILEELSHCEEPSRCPHGRPTMIKITQRDLDKMFLRTL
jgi:DNA mismatch repair protein MutL